MEKGKNMFVGLIYNYKGIKEENYLYPLKEYEALQASGYPAVIGEYAFTANKTYTAVKLSGEEAELFLKGEYNDELNDDWYYENMSTCLFTGKELKCVIKE